ncbi:MAG: uroporphyrinogen-III synthase [Pseudomonadota bacterium]
MLTGLRVVLTRTEEQNIPLAQAIEQAGGIPISFPTMAIESVEHDQALGNASNTDILIFTSANAAAHLKHLPSGAETSYCVAMGPGTAAQILARGWRVDWVAPKGATTETLLSQLPTDLIKGTNVCLVRGLNGRTMLRTALASQVTKLYDLVVYRRICPDRWSITLPALADAVVIASIDGFRHWVHLLGPTQLSKWADVPHLLTSQRQLQLVKSMPCFTQLRCAVAPDPGSVMTALSEWNLLELRKKK